MPSNCKKVISPLFAHDLFKKGRKKELRCVANVYGRNATLFFFLPAGRIQLITLNQAVGRSKFDRGPYLACGPDFGHACFKPM